MNTISQPNPLSWLCCVHFSKLFINILGTTNYSISTNKYLPVTTGVSETDKEWVCFVRKGVTSGIKYKDTGGKGRYRTLRDLREVSDKVVTESPKKKKKLTLVKKNELFRLLYPSFRLKRTETEKKFLPDKRDNRFSCLRNDLSPDPTWLRGPEPPTRDLRPKRLPVLTQWHTKVFVDLLGQKDRGGVFWVGFIDGDTNRF